MCLSNARGVLVVVDGAVTKSAIRRGRIASTAATVLPGAMERPHDPSMNAYGRVEHVYSPREVSVITQKISDGK